MKEFYHVLKPLYDKGFMRVLTYMTKYLPLLLLAVIAFTPLTSHAAGIEYASVTEYSETEALIKKATFTGDIFYRCQIVDGSCVEVPADTKVLAPGANATPAYMIAYRNLLPAGATRMLRSEDGRYISFYIAGTQSRGNRTFGVLDTTDLSTYTKDEKLGYWDLLSEGIRVFAISPDSKTLVYIGDAKNHPTLYKVNLTKLEKGNKTLPVEKMFAKDYTIADVQFADNDTLLFIANRESPHMWSLYRYTISSGALKKVADNVSYGVNLNKTGSVFLFAEAGEYGIRPKMYNPTTGVASQFSHPFGNAEPTKGKEVVKLAGGLSGVFLLEPSGKSDTLLVWLHGGPYRQTSLFYHPYMSYGGYDWVLEKVRDSDVGVLKLDYPGSYGYGRTLAESLIGKVGVKDVTDSHTAITDFAKRNGYKNVYLMGNSYGGYLAPKLLVDKPKSYKGAFAINGVMDWTTMLTALDTSIFNVLFKGTVGAANDNYDEYNKASIYNNIEGLTGQKMILMHGEKDMTIGKRQSEGLATYMNSVNEPVELIIMPGEDHVYKKPASFILLCEKALAFVGRAGKTSCAI